MLAFGCGGKKAATSAPMSPGGDGAALNGCTTYKDLTNVGAHDVTWDESIAKSEDRCVKLKVDQPMSWVGNFTKHPIKAAGGETPSPFDTAMANLNGGEDDKQSAPLVFSKAGTYGYVCGVHPDMTGAVLVVP